VLFSPWSISPRIICFARIFLLFSTCWSPCNTPVVDIKILYLEGGRSPTGKHKILRKFFYSPQQVFSCPWYNNIKDNKVKFLFLLLCSFGQLQEKSVPLCWKLALNLLAVYQSKSCPLAVGFALRFLWVNSNMRGCWCSSFMGNRKLVGF